MRCTPDLEDALMYYKICQHILYKNHFTEIQQTFTRKKHHELGMKIKSCLTPEMEK